MHTFTKVNILSKVLGCCDTVQEWSHVRMILSTCGNTPIKQDNSLVSSVSLRHGIVLGAFSAPPRCSKSEFTSVYLWWLVDVIQFFVSIEKHVLATCGLCLWLYTAWIHEYFTQVAFLNLQSIDCLRLWVKMAIALDFSHLFYQLHSPCSHHSRQVTLGRWLGS